MEGSDRGPLCNEHRCIPEVKALVRAGGTSEARRAGGLNTLSRSSPEAKFHHYATCRHCAQPVLVRDLSSSSRQGRRHTRAARLRKGIQTLMMKGRVIQQRKALLKTRQGTNLIPEATGSGSASAAYTGCLDTDRVAAVHVLVVSPDALGDGFGETVYFKAVSQKISLSSRQQLRSTF